MRVKVDRVIATHAQDPPVLGLPHFGTPERRRAREGQGGQRHASGKASPEERTPTHTWGRLCVLCGHRAPSRLTAPTRWCRKTDRTGYKTESFSRAADRPRSRDKW